MASCTPLRPEMPKLALAPELSTMTPSRIGCSGLFGSLQAARSTAKSKAKARRLIRMLILALLNAGNEGRAVRVAGCIQLDRALQTLKATHA